MGAAPTRRVDFGAHVWLRDVDNPGSTWVMYYVTRYPSDEKRCLGPEDTLTSSLLGAVTHEIRDYLRPSDGRALRVEVCKIHPGQDKPATLIAKPQLQPGASGSGSLHHSPTLKGGAKSHKAAQEDQALRILLVGCRQRTVQALSQDDMASLRACATQLAGILANHRLAAVPRMNAHGRECVIDILTLALRGFLSPEDINVGCSWLHKIGRIVPALHGTTRPMASTLNGLSDTLAKWPTAGTPKARSMYYVALGRALLGRLETRLWHSAPLYTLVDHFYRLALTEIPNDAVALNALGAVLRRQGRSAVAQATFREAIENAKKQGYTKSAVYAYTGLGAAIMDEERYLQAASVLHAGLDLKPEWPDPRESAELDKAKELTQRLLSWCYARWGQYGHLPDYFSNLEEEGQREMGQGLYRLGERHWERGEMLELGLIIRTLDVLGLRHLSGKLKSLMTAPACGT